jgi:hypothetical protein
LRVRKIRKRLFVIGVWWFFGAWKHWRRSAWLAKRLEISSKATPSLHHPAPRSRMGRVFGRCWQLLSSLIPPSIASVTNTEQSMRTFLRFFDSRKRFRWMATMNGLFTE